MRALIRFLGRWFRQEPRPPAKPAKPVPFNERWLAYPDEKRLKLAGSTERLAELDAFAALPLADREAALEDLSRGLKRSVTRMHRYDRRYRELLRERNAAMIECAILGDRQVDIAKEAGVTPMIVSHALGKSKRSS